MRLGIIEDNQNMFINAVNEFRTLSCDEPNEISPDETLFFHLNDPDRYWNVLMAIKAASGPLILFVDLDLLIKGRILGEAMTLLDLDKSESDLLDQLSDSDETKKDGLLAIRTAIRNMKLNPLLIGIASGLGSVKRVEPFIRHVIAASGRSETARYLFLDDHFASSDIARQLCSKAITYYNSAFGEPVVKFLSAIKPVTHCDCNRANTRALSPLFGFLSFPNLEEFERSLGSIKAMLVNSLKGMAIDSENGSCAQRTLGAAGGWLLALGAFRKQWPDEEWRSRFCVDDLISVGSVAAESEIVAYQQPETLSETIRLYYEMCERLFERIDAEAPCRVTKVRLNEKGKLSIDVKFDPLSNGEASLFSRIAESCALSLRGGIQSHQTSLAIWRFFLCSSVSDAPDRLAQDGVFGQFRRMQMRAVNNTLSVTFGE